MSWFRVSGGRLRYRGRITRDPFTAWAATREGSEALDAVAATMRFRLFASARAARRVWRALDRATRTEALRQALQSEADRYLAVMANVSYAASLPRTTVALRRLVVVPRAMIVGRARQPLWKRLRSSGALAEVPEAARVFLVDRLLTEMDAAVRNASPSPRRPVGAHDGWGCVAVDPQFVWVDPLWSGDEWTGHVFMYEIPPSGLSRQQRKDLAAAITRLREDLPSLSRIERDGLVRSAIDSLALAR